MKRPIVLLMLAFTAATVHAGSFGGPPPFQNGSPLTSGVNGNYQASARGSNLSGIITFCYSAGIQTTSATQNHWYIFYQGEVFNGWSDVAINDGDIAGVLEASLTAPVNRVTTTTDPTTGTVTTVTLAAVSNPGGYFNAKLNNNSPTGTFKGTGVLSGVFSDTTDVGGTTTTVTTEPISAPYKVKGVRAATGT